MDTRAVFSEGDPIADLQSPSAEVRRKAAERLGVLSTGDDREVSALMDVMQNDCDEKVRGMAYWALSSPANLKIISQHPDWQARLRPVEPTIRRKPCWWAALLKKLKIPGN